MPLPTLTRNGSKAWGGFTASSARTACLIKSSWTKSSPTVLFIWRRTTGTLPSQTAKRFRRQESRGRLPIRQAASSCADPTTGEPTGVLKEAAEQLVAKVIPQSTREEELDRLTKAIHYASSLGLTRLISAGADAERVDLFDEIRKKGDLTARFTMARFTNAPVTPDEIKILEENRKKYADDWIDAGQVKFLLDGVIEAHTAAMLEPYEKDPSNRGLLYFDPEKYKESVIQLDRLGFPISTHAIGDRAIRLALDAYEAANKANGRTEVPGSNRAH